MTDTNVPFDPDFDAVSAPDESRPDEARKETTTILDVLSPKQGFVFGLGVALFAAFFLGFWVLLYLALR